MRFYKNQVTPISFHHCPSLYAAVFSTSVNPTCSEPKTDARSNEHKKNFFRHCLLRLRRQGEQHQCRSEIGDKNFVDEGRSFEKFPICKRQEASVYKGDKGQQAN